MGVLVTMARKRVHAPTWFPDGFVTHSDQKERKYDRESPIEEMAMDHEGGAVSVGVGIGRDAMDHAYHSDVEDGSLRRPRAKRIKVRLLLSTD